MKKRSDAPHILVIRFSLGLYGDLSDKWEMFLSGLRSTGMDVETFDAGVDFLDRFLPDAGGGHSLCEPWGLDPMALLSQQKTLDTVLESANKAHGPGLFHRHGFGHPKLNQGDDVRRFASDAAANPFRAYAVDHWRPFDNSRPPVLALLLVERPGQVGPVFTLASVWQARWPRIPVRLAGPKCLPKSLVALLSEAEEDVSTAASTVLAAVDQIMAGVAQTSSRPHPTGMKEHRESGWDQPRPMIAEHMPAMVAEALENNRRFLAWQWHGGALDAVTRQLYAASRQGLWNHLILEAHSPAALKDFASANANIVHSYGHRDDPLSAFSDPVIRFPSATAGYGRTRPMPGRPLWMALQDAFSIQMLLAQYDTRTLMRLRLRNDGQSCFEVGKGLTYHFKPPHELPDGYLDEIVKMVEAGGSVNTTFVRSNLERAFLIAYVEEEGVIVGNSSLKRPRDEYIDAVSRQAGIDLHNYLERGYTSVRPEYRGLGVGAKLLEGLTQRAGEHSIFSVISENNIATQKMAIRNRTRRVAVFYSQIAKKEMGVWIPQWMIPDGVELPEQPDPDATPKEKKGPK